MVVIPFYKWQLDLMEAVEDPDVEQVAAVGTRGPGKSHSARHVNIIRALQMPNTDHIIFRRTSDDIVKQYAPATRQLLSDFYGQRIVFDYNQTYRVFNIKCPGGGSSRVFLGFAETIKHAEKYQSFEYATITWDEVTHFEDDILRFVSGSLRGIVNSKQIFFGNPGGVGHSSVKRRFVNKETRDKKTVVLQPRLWENKELMKRDPGYVERLLSGQPDWRKRQWLDGDWDANEGAYFMLPSASIREVKIPYWAKGIAGVDGGYWPGAFGVTFSYYWEDYNNVKRLHIYRDLKLYRTELTAQAEAALNVEETLPIPMSIRWADPMTSGRRIEGEGDVVSRTMAKVWRKCGFVTQAAKRHSRVAGWMLLRELMKPIYQNPHYGIPGAEHGILTIDPSCRATIDEIQEAQFQQGKGKQGEGGDIRDENDDLLDTLRYKARMTFGLAFRVKPTSAYDPIDPNLERIRN